MKLNMILTLLLFVLMSCNKSDDGTISNPDLEIQKGKIEASINVNGTTRDYIIHIPENYSGDNAFPLLFAFHGLGGNMNSSYNNSKFYLLAESENFIVVHPNGISSQWNAVTVNDNIDINFIEQLIFKLENEYNINSNQIYSCGMSNGGYFSFLLACELSDKIAGIGSIAGLMFENVLNNCQPTRPLPIIQIHGTDDALVNYSNVNEVLTFWINHNNTNTIPTETDIPNTDTTDGSYVKRFIYKNGNSNVEVHHLKIIGGAHQWPGYEGNMDINASEEIWNFLKLYNLNGKIE